MFAREYSSTNFITGLRGIAILMVFLIHSGGGGLREISSSGDRAVSMGMYGVDIFFVISGFTIFYQFYSRNYSIINFLKIRLLRVSIPYFPIIIFMYFYVIFGGNFTNNWAIIYNNGEISLLNLITHLFYLSYINEVFANTIIGIEWTLSIEVFFYVVLGFMIVNLKKLDTINKTFFWMILFFFISVLGIFISKFTNNGLLYQWMPFKYGYMFLLGGLAYHLRSKLSQILEIKKLNIFSSFLIIFSIPIFLIFITTTKIPNISILNELFFAILTFILIIFVQDSAKYSNIFVNKVIVSIGSISFSMYLVHLLVINFFSLEIDSFSKNSSLNFVYLLFMTIIFSTIYYWIFELKVYRTVKSKIMIFKK